MSKKLLLADDSMTIQKVIQITFAHEDYQLTITDNGDKAFDRARDLVPDLVLADIYMPGLNGYELCAAIKQHPALKHVPVLLLAGSFEPFDESKARAAGADGWIEKPFESQALIDKVAGLLATAPVPEAVADVVEKAPEEAADVVEEVPEEAGERVLDGAEPFAEFSFDEPAFAAAGADDFVFEELAASEPDFEFSDESFVVEADKPSVAPVPAPASASQVDFAAAEEVLSLGDDDILGAEDLEPIAETPTLSRWSRDKLSGDEPFPAVAEFEMAQAEVAEPAALPTVAGETDEAPAVVARVETVVAPEEPSAPTAEPFDVGQRAETLAELSEEDLERIVERAVTRAIEKLAGHVVERVAWEVVPDMAEALIKEEIRQIKETAG